MLVLGVFTITSVYLSVVVPTLEVALGPKIADGEPQDTESI